MDPYNQTTLRAFQELVDSSGKVTGRICHIRGHSAGGSRFDAAQSDTERHGFDNLLLLCPIHHDVIDADPDAYTVETLLEMKRRHETGIRSGSEPTDEVAQQLIANIDAGSGSTVVISHNQAGGITAGTVNINAAPEPTLQAYEVFANRLENSEYHSRVMLMVDSPYLPANLYVAVHAPSIRRIELAPQRTGLVMMGHCGTREGMAFANLQHPFGRLYLEVFTSKPERLEIEWDIH